MANKKSNSNYTLVYVFGPTRCKDLYLEGSILDRDNGEFVKIGKTDYPGELCECNEESMKSLAIERCAQETKTGISDWCDIYDIFIFPQKDSGNVDDALRNLLCNDIYSLANSKDESKESKGDIKPGKEYVYGVSRNHIKHAVESYCYQLIIHSTADKLQEIQTICQLNSISEDDEEECEQGCDERKERCNRDITTILSPGDTVYLSNARSKNKPVFKVKDGPQITATYVGKKKFQFEDGVPTSASKLALELINKYSGETYDVINGNACWQINVAEEGEEPKLVTLSAQCDSMVNGD